MGKWQFNETCLKNVIEQGQKFLISDELTQRQRREITSDITHFKKFLNGNFENEERTRKLNSQQLMHNILNGMKRYRRIFEPNLMDWFIELNKSRIFKYRRRMKVFKLPMEDMASETLKVYRTSAPLFYRCAKQIIDCDDINLIQEAKIDSSSYCFYSDLLRLPFIVINTGEDSYVLNHEVQHAIEYILNIQTPELYSEFGPMYFESLFIDGVFDKYGKKALSGTVRRIQDIEEDLDLLSTYLYAMSVFAHHNFEVEEDFFYEVFSEATGLDGDLLYNFLNREFTNSKITETLNYVMSFLKVIEIRDFIQYRNDDGRTMFNDLLFSRKFSFTPPQNGFESYERFVDDVKQKLR